METLTTTIEWHLAEKELPVKSGEYLVVTPSGIIYDTDFSAKHRRFCCNDWWGETELKEFDVFPIVYWAERPSCFSWDSMRKYREDK